MARCSSSHVRTGSRASGTMAQVRIRPSLEVEINPASSSTERCRITVGRRSPVGPARSVTCAGVSASRVRIDRRVGSASAWKSRDRSGSCLAMSLTIAQFAAGASENFVNSLSFFPPNAPSSWSRRLPLPSPLRSCSQPCECTPMPAIEDKFLKPPFRFPPDARRKRQHRKLPNANFISRRGPGAHCRTPACAAVEGTSGKIQFSRTPGTSVWQWAWWPIQIVDRNPAEPDRFRILHPS